MFIAYTTVRFFSGVTVEMHSYVFGEFILVDWLTGIDQRAQTKNDDGSKIIT
jgi:hypothetical protein